MKTRAADDRVSHESRFQDALFHPFVDKVDDADVFRTIAAKDFHVRFAVVLTFVELNNIGMIFLIATEKCRIKFRDGSHLHRILYVQIMFCHVHIRVTD